MNDNIKELVKRLRDERSIPWKVCNEAADALEALAGEVERLTMEVKTATTLLEAEKWSRAHVRSIIVSDLEAERDRLKETIETATKFNEGLAAERDRLKAALVKARHELVTHNGLYATDIYPENREQLLQNGVNIEWQIDVSAVLETIDAALGDAS